MVGDATVAKPIANPSFSPRHSRAEAPSGLAHEAGACDHPSIDEWIVGTLKQRGSVTLEQVAAPLGQVNWSEVFLAIDRLSRGGRILLWPSSAGDLVLSLKAIDRYMP